MAVKTILVSLNDHARFDALMGVATQLASQHDAHLIGLYVLPAMVVNADTAMFVSVKLFEGYEKIHEQRAEEIAGRFAQEIQRQGVNGEFRKADSQTPCVADQVIAHGRQCDLLIIGQVNEDGSNGLELDFAERVTVEAGRPVIVVPLAGDFEKIGARVLVGWNATREAARAVHDAMPILERASEVHIVWANPEDDGELSDDLPGAELATNLARHGIRVIAQPVPAHGPGVGDTLLNQVSDTGADLLTMGAYGHSRMRELILGGASRSILRQMTVPVLFSH